MGTIITTVTNRPYVFIFLLTFLALGRIYFGGWKRTLIWLVLVYLIAWASELSSIHNGFPYGLYHYRYENMAGELMVAGVPFWDSLSYPFLIFAGWTTARFIYKGPGTAALGLKPNIITALFGAFLTMLLDVIIDPLTVLGERWFLGNIYYYPNGGQYFGVPLTNFAGWFLVPLAVILFYQIIDRLFLNGRPRPSSTWMLGHLLNPLFYLSIALFNIVITFWIGEHILASIDCLLLAPVVWLITYRTKNLKQLSA